MKRLPFRLTILVCAAASGPALAVPAFWTNAGAGAWNDPLNWDIGLPAAVDTPSINNGGTAIIDGSMAIAAGLTAVGGTTGTTGSLEVTGGSLTVASDLRIGGSAANGTGVLTLSGGLVTMNPGNFNIGFGPAGGGASGTVNLSGTGSVYVRNAAAIMAVGNRGTGTVNQTGGDVFLSSSGATGSVLNLGRNSTGAGNGTYNLSAGRVTAATLQFGNAVQAAGTNVFALSGTGSLTAGTITVVNTGASNTFNFTGGSLSTAAVNFPLTNNGGTLRPGVFNFAAATADAVLTDPTGTTTFGTNVSYRQNSGTLAIDIDGPASNDLVSAGVGASNGSVTLAGTIEVTLAGGYDPPPGSTFDIVTADAILNSAVITGTTPGGHLFAPSTAAGDDGRRVLRLTVMQDADGDLMGDDWETAHGLNPAVNDAALDADTDFSSNLQEYRRGTDPQDSDTDNDLVPDGHETGTGVWVNATNTGTNPFLPDSDADGLTDAVENPDLPWAGPAQTGSNPNLVDSDGDLFSDGQEVSGGSNPASDLSQPNPAADSTVALDLESTNPAVQFGFTGMGPASGWTGAFGTVNVTISPVGSTTLDHRDRGAAGGGGGYNPLYRDFVFALNSDADGDGLEITITGLTPLQTYPVSLWSWDPASAPTPRRSTWLASDGDLGLAVAVPLYVLDNGAALPVNLTDRRLKFDAKADSTGTLVVRGIKEQGYLNAAALHNVFLNGLILGPAVTPVVLTQTGPLTGTSFPLTWTSDDFATYSVETSLNLVEWSPLNSSVDGQAGTTTFTDSGILPGITRGFYRVTRVSP